MTDPSVTVAIPVLNEERHIESCLAAIEAQTYPHVIEVLVVDGGSADRTRELASRFPAVRVLDNPARRQAPGLNLALNQARGEIFVRVDGHCRIAEDYVERCVNALKETGAAMTGGAISASPSGGFQRTVAAAMESPLGVGTARFHRPHASPEWVDTVYLGASPTATLRRVGGYASDYTANEDAELAWRLRREGGVWFDPQIRSQYEPRATPTQLARQYFNYGRGRIRTACRHPRSLSMRQLAAPGLLLGLVSPWRKVVAIAYAGVLVGAGFGSRRRSWRVAVQVPLAVMEMHAAWGLGFLTGLPEAIRRRSADEDHRR